MGAPVRSGPVHILPPGDGVAEGENQIIMAVAVDVGDPDREVALGAAHQVRGPYRAVAVVAVPPNLVADFHHGVEAPIAVDVSDANPWDLAIRNSNHMRSKRRGRAAVVFIPNDFMTWNHIHSPINFLEYRLTGGGNHIQAAVAVDVPHGRRNVRAAEPGCDRIHGNERHCGKKMAVLEKLDFQPKSSLECFFTPQDFSLPRLYPAREH